MTSRPQESRAAWKIRAIFIIVLVSCLLVLSRDYSGVSAEPRVGRHGLKRQARGVDIKAKAAIENHDTSLDEDFNDAEVDELFAKRRANSKSSTREEEEEDPNSKYVVNYLSIDKGAGPEKVAANFEVGGDAEFVGVDHSIRLTPDMKNKVGWVWSKQPLNSPNWVVEADILVGRSDLTVQADGVAIWAVQKGTHIIGRAFGSEEVFHGVGIILDTYRNDKTSTNRLPTLGVYYNDGTKRYRIDNDGLDLLVASCFPKPFAFGDTFTVRVTYIREHGITLDIRNQVNGRWQECALDVKVPDLPSTLSLGISAMTGGASESNDIVALRTYSVNSVAKVRESYETQKHRYYEAEAARIRQMRQEEASSRRDAHLDAGEGVYGTIFRLSVSLFVISFAITAFAMYVIRVIRLQYYKNR